MSRRYVDEEELVAWVIGWFPAPERPGVERKLRSWLGRQPTLPRLISSAGMAKLLGVSRPNIYKRPGRPEGVPVQGGADVYLTEEAEAWKADIDREKETT